MRAYLRSRTSISIFSTWKAVECRGLQVYRATNCSKCCFGPKKPRVKKLRSVASRSRWRNVMQQSRRQLFSSQRPLPPVSCTSQDHRSTSLFFSIFSRAPIQNLSWGRINLILYDWSHWKTKHLLWDVWSGERERQMVTPVASSRSALGVLAFGQLVGDPAPGTQPPPLIVNYCSGCSSFRKKCVSLFPNDHS